MNAALDRGGEDETSDSLSNVWARGQEEQTPHADRISTDDNKSDGFARGGSKNTHKESDSVTVNDFCVAVEERDEDVFSF